MDSDLTEYSIQYAQGVGPQRAKLLSRLGIKTIRDALYYLPCRYEDRSNLHRISSLREGDTDTVKGRIISADIKRRGRKFRIFELIIDDETGLLKGRWFNQPFLKRNFRVGQDVILSGIVKIDHYWGKGFVIDNPEYELLPDRNDSCLHTNRVVPIYRLTEGLSQKQFRRIMFGIVDGYGGDVPDTIPSEIISRNKLAPLARSIHQAHFPEDPLQIDSLNRGLSAYHRRLSFDELFLFEAGLASLRKGIQFDRGIAFSCAGTLQMALLKILPFELTSAQKRAVDEIVGDMRRPFPMRRLIQGDVGCGKTVVALLAMLNAVESGYQAALMAPTEILAEQHYLNIHRLIEHLGLKVELLTGSSTGRKLDGIASGETPIITGTHALIQEGVKFRNLGLAVIDEQHKFGVLQRKLLRKKGRNPDVLVMTATPIPRSLSLTLYGDLDVSVIDELPPGRKPVITELYHPGQKAEIYSLLRRAVGQGKQAYIVYPAIEDSEKIDLKSAVQGKEALERMFPEFTVELLHGRIPSSDREKKMIAFKNKEVDILVSTTVIEVGMDVPNATVMLIIHAERFGLAQLHQLRGRVGRGSDRSYCLLLAYEPYGEEARRRLEAMIRSNDGFRIAEEDLLIRGPGEFFGTKQAGMPDFKVAKLFRDMDILETARKEAFTLIDNSPSLEQFPSLKKSIEVFWKGKVDFYKTG